jgi:hypothetical protein
VHLQIQNNPELSEIIMEINDLQKSSLDNQPLAQTVLEINDFRGFATQPPPPHHAYTRGCFRAESAESAEKGREKRSAINFISAASAPLARISSFRKGFGCGLPCFLPLRPMPFLAEFGRDA